MRLAHGYDGGLSAIFSLLAARKQEDWGDFA